MPTTLILFFLPVWLFSVACDGDLMPETGWLRDGDTFDYIVVGAGAAGCAAAARLALAGFEVLLVEAGGNPLIFSKIPGTAQALLGSSMDYAYETVPNNASCLAFQNQRCRFSRGRGLGGSTSTNFMMHARGNPRDFDDLNIPGWTWKDMLPFFLRFEGLQDLDELPETSVPYHNTTGPMKMQFFTDSGNPWNSRLIDGFESLNFPYNKDVNAASQIGATKIVGFVSKNERMTTARGYLGRDDVKKYLKVATSTTCTGVIIEDGDLARGITVSYGAFQIPLKLYATKEVILSAGALETPRILMLSGIGPSEHLRKFNIPVVLDLPVGDNMTDHVSPLVLIKVDKGEGIDKFTSDIIGATMKVTQLAQLLFLWRGPLTSNGLTDVSALLNMNCYDFENRQLTNNSSECEVPNIQFIHSYINRNLVWLVGSLFQQATNFNTDVTEQLSEISRNYALITMNPLLLRAFSQGSVRLASADPLAPPAIFPNFLSDERDLEEMVRAITLIEHLMETPVYKKHNASIVHLKFPGCPEYETDRMAYLRCYSRHMTQSGYHAVGTAGVGRVVDAQLRVRGARRLRVADLSVLPDLPRANTAAAAIAIGERLAHFILDHNNS